MRNVRKHGYGTASFDEVSSAGVYSLVSEASGSNAITRAAAASDAGSASSEEGDVDYERVPERDVLILDGGEKEAGDEGSAGSARGPTSAPLSVPASVFLPSEIGSVAAVSVSGVTQATAKDQQHDAGEHPVAKQTARGGRGSPFRVTAALALLVAVVAFTSWTARVHKHEVLRLRKELRRRTLLLPLALALSKERESLREQLAFLAAEAERARGAGPGPARDDAAPFPPGTADAAALLSVKNCYVEASLSLGRCAREWQRWPWSEAAEGSAAEGRGARQARGEARPERSAHEFAEEVAQDVTKLVASVSDGLAAAGERSYTALANAARQFSHEGLKAAVSVDDYLYAAFPAAHRTASQNDAGGKAEGRAQEGSFERAWSKLWSEAGGSRTDDRGATDYR